MLKSIIVGIILSVILILSSCKKTDNGQNTQGCSGLAAFTYTLHGDTIFLKSTDTVATNHHYWTFDGNSAATDALSLTHVYAGTGTYSVCLKVVKTATNCTDTLCQSVTITPYHPHLIFKFVFDSTQVRLDNFGQPASMPAGHAGQNPMMNVMSAHYVELAPNGTTALGAGVVLYQTPTTTAGGASAIDFSKEPLTANNGVVYQVALDSVTPGSYQWLRVSLAYQNFNAKLYYDTSFTYMGFPVTVQQDFPCTVASFVGYNTYVTSYTVSTQSITANSNEAQGYWGFESKGTYNYSIGGTNYPYPYNFLSSGQSPAGATTVVNPLHSTSPIPPGSCVATGQFTNASGASNTTLNITGHETSDIVVVVSLSVNKSFEWVDSYHADGKWEPSKGEKIVDMGIRGLVPKVQ